jgi:hypothetical protein
MTSDFRALADELSRQTDGGTRLALWPQGRVYDGAAAATERSGRTRR